MDGRRKGRERTNCSPRIIAASSGGASLSSGWQHGWMIPFISRYRLSNSVLLGFGKLSTDKWQTQRHVDDTELIEQGSTRGTWYQYILLRWHCWPPCSMRNRIVTHWASDASAADEWMMYDADNDVCSGVWVHTYRGYRRVNHLKNAGTPICRWNRWFSSRHRRSIR